MAPKLIGGHDAPTPLGDLGLQQMTQALPLCDTTYELFGPDLLISGYLPSSGGLASVERAVSQATGSSGAAPAGRVCFYKAWDECGALSNFSPHPIAVDGLEWPTVEVRRAMRARILRLLTLSTHARRRSTRRRSSQAWTRQRRAASTRPYARRARPRPQRRSGARRSASSRVRCAPTGSLPSRT